MPVLNWIGKDYIINHDKEVPFRIMKPQKQFSVGDNSENLVICGDNLEALKAVMPFYYGKVKCVYIDPPYNTGKGDWVYNDRVDAPKIREWLGKVVGSESEDLSRHDKWLCMMYPRLKLLRDLLREDGVIFISIDDNELHNTRILFDEIFGENNFLGTIIWKTATDNNPSQIAVQHEYIVCYAKNKANQDRWLVESHAASLLQQKYDDLKKTIGNNPIKIQEKLRYWMNENKDSLDGVLHYRYVDSKGIYYPDNPSNTRAGGYKFKILHPLTKKPCRIPPNGFRFTEKTFMEMLSRGDIEFGKNENITPKPKKRLSNAKELLRSVYYEDNRRSTNELAELMGGKVFNNPKSPRLIKHLLSFTTRNDDIILDSFAGSGTTAQAVFELNKEDGGCRKFVLVELEEKICKEVTVERLKKIIKKLGTGSFQFCELGKQLFNECGQIDENCSYNDLARYIFFTETKTNLDVRKINKNLIGTNNGVVYYLLFNGGKHTNILDKYFLKGLDKKTSKVVYADQCLIGDETLEKFNITFKQIPYEIKEY